MTEISTTLLSVTFLLTFLLSAGLVYVAIALGRRFVMLDLPGERQSHSQPTLTGGGIGIVSSLVLSSLVFTLQGLVAQDWVFIVLPGVVVLSVIGWMDDRRPVSARFRLFVQLAVSFALIGSLVFAGKLNGWLIPLLAGVAIVWIMNVYNFMDGSHGMAGFQGVFAGLLLALIFLFEKQPLLLIPSLLIAASCAGFLPFNMPNPRIFMGDAGSVPLGFAISALLVMGLTVGALSFPAALLVLAVFLVDGSLTLLKRVIRGEQWYTAHKQHVYQRLIRQGWPHSRVLLLYQAVNIILVVPVVILVTMYPMYAWPLTGMSFLLLAAGWYIASRKLEVRN